MEESDISWIEEQLKQEKNMEETFNKFQWSRFIGGRDGDQIVVRGSNFEEFLLDVSKAKVEFDVDKTLPKSAPPQTYNTPTVDQSGHYCQVCRGPMEFKSGVGKSGKPWKGYFCSASKDHPVEWMR